MDKHAHTHWSLNPVYLWCGIILAVGVLQVSGLIRLGVKVNVVLRVERRWRCGIEDCGDCGVRVVVLNLK